MVRGILNAKLRPAVNSIDLSPNYRRIINDIFWVPGSFTVAPQYWKKEQGDVSMPPTRLKVGDLVADVSPALRQKNWQFIGVNEKVTLSGRPDSKCIQGTPLSESADFRRHFGSV